MSRSQSLGYGLNDWGSIPGRGNDGIFHFAIASREALDPTQPSLHWAPRLLAWELSSCGVKLTTHHQLVPSLPYIFMA